MKGVGVFPDLRAPRILWVGVEGAELFELHERVQECLIKLAIKPDQRPFSPHISIGRMKQPTALQRLSEKVLSLGQHHFGFSEVSKLILYRSDLTPRGSIHTPLGEIALGKEG